MCLACQIYGRKPPIPKVFPKKKNNLHLPKQEDNKCKSCKLYGKKPPIVRSKDVKTRSVVPKQYILCSVCLDRIETPYVLYCNHPFHEQCIFKWFEIGTISCPMCRCDLIEKN